MRSESGKLYARSPLVADSEHESVDWHILLQEVGNVSVRLEESMEPDVADGLIFSVKEDVRC